MSIRIHTIHCHVSIILLLGHSASDINYYGSCLSMKITRVLYILDKHSVVKFTSAQPHHVLSHSSKQTDTHAQTEPHVESRLRLYLAVSAGQFSLIN